MTLWRYTAIDRRDTAAVRRHGELSGDSAAEVRAALRRIGLQVIELKPLRVNTLRSLTTLDPLQGPLQILRGHQRARRRVERAELYDSLATMLESGVPLLEAVETIAQSGNRKRSMRDMLLHMREKLRAGGSLGSAMAEHGGWFDGVEIAMVQAAQHAGTLPGVLRRLTERQQRAGALAQKLTTALTYPAIVSMVGIGVVVFLSVKTLPNLVQILLDAKIEPPRLTLNVMAVGGLLAHHWWLIGLSLLALLVAIVFVSSAVRQYRIEPPRLLRRVRRLRPQVLRRMAVAGAMLQLAELLRTGVPLVDALRIVAPTTPGSAQGGLRHLLMQAADRVERGDELGAALDDELYFDAEFRRLLNVGQATGELDAPLERLGRRYERQVVRLIDRLATYLEPAVILFLALLVGIVVMAAVLPLIRLQEVL
jgi:type II secretory pathway component PulF